MNNTPGGTGEAPSRARRTATSVRARASRRRPPPQPNGTMNAAAFIRLLEAGGDSDGVMARIVVNGRPARVGTTGTGTSRTYQGTFFTEPENTIDDARRPGSVRDRGSAPRRTRGRRRAPYEILALSDSSSPSTSSEDEKEDDDDAFGQSSTAPDPSRDREATSMSMDRQNVVPGRDGDRGEEGTRPATDTHDMDLEDEVEEPHTEEPSGRRRAPHMTTAPPQPETADVPIPGALWGPMFWGSMASLSSTTTESLLDQALSNLLFEQVLRTSAAEAANAPSSGGNGLPSTLLNALPVTTIDTCPSAGSDNTTCAICMDDFAVGDSVRTLSCAHAYHLTCIDRWLKDHDTCPHCRARAFDRKDPRAAALAARDSETATYLGIAAARVSEPRRGHGPTAGQRPRSGESSAPPSAMMMTTSGSMSGWLDAIINEALGDIVREASS